MNVFICMANLLCKYEFFIYFLEIMKHAKGKSSGVTDFQMKLIHDSVREYVNFYINRISFVKNIAMYI